MNAKLVLILAVVVAAIGVAAYYSGLQKDSLKAIAYERGPMFVGIENRINDVDELRIESQEGGVLTLVRKDGQWALQEHYGYIADQERVTGFLKRIATLERIEPKTKKPENYKRLNIGDPTDEFSLATRMTLKVGDDVVADFVSGLNRPPKIGGGVFMREFAEAQSWLVDGGFKPKRRTMDWLQRNIVNIDGRRIANARIQRPALDEDGKVRSDGAVAELVLVAKETPDQAEYSLGAEIPEGYKPKPDHELSAVARISDFLILEDVKPASEVDLIGASISTYETYDGLRLIYHSKKQADGQVWMAVKLEPMERWQGLDAYIADQKGKDTDAGRIAGEFKTPDAVKAEIAEWNTRTAGWAYRLTDYKTKRLAVHTQDVIAKVDAKQGQPQQ